MVGARSSGRTGTALFEHERCCCCSCDDLSSLRKVLLDSCHAAVEFPPSITVVADDDEVVVVAGLTSNDMERDGNCLLACVCVERCRRRRCVQ